MDTPQPHQFAHVPLIGQRQQQNQQQMQAQIQAAINQLSIGIYSQLASAHVATRDEHQTVDREQLQKLAKDAQTAALAYFEGIGVVKQNEPKKDEIDAD